MDGKHDTNSITGISPEASYMLRKAVQEHEQIGWDQVFYGRISQEWGRLYKHDITSIDHGLTNPSTEKWGIAWRSCICFFSIY
jgi:hypothetical protein